MRSKHAYKHALNAFSLRINGFLHGVFKCVLVVTQELVSEWKNACRFKWTNENKRNFCQHNTIHLEQMETKQNTSKTAAIMESRKTTTNEYVDKQTNFVARLFRACLLLFWRDGCKTLPTWTELFLENSQKFPDIITTTAILFQSLLCWEKERSSKMLSKKIKLGINLL